LRARAILESKIKSYEAVATALDDVELYVEMAESGDAEAIEERDNALSTLESKVDEFELRLMLSGEYDACNAIIEVHPGAGGTESQDWAEMLTRMYLRWGERRGFKVKVIEMQPGDGAGLKSATFLVEGEYAYGYLRAESGVHRLVRISPFDNAGRRHTSFASVLAVPEIDDSIEVEINDDDLRVDTFRASGAGGQHVNKTDSAVRLTHAPTGIVVVCQNERSQHKNRATAMKVLKARIYEVERRKQEEKMAAIGPSKSDNAFGSQIRSYVLHPYQMVKDLRTQTEVGNTEAVLDGDIDIFIKEYLLKDD
jgi:peptide chain release factor 2